ncbi:HNH endonuclease signature motif containing protein [Allomesorhizobium alhagi]|uniref:HNH nuclease domain-containing protein n=1 Tax=Mesorhizobium alhagi CCNWXJ12-2 TaxID=1107882 RepID=H0HNL6_9HYPH|nr:HNH endonuclease signature motif containing protein [Mesorhizobium alhagi]EHK57669.1 hypothetical protein MAXJ12_08694 [Mesorhizobium alhagi CCNWXJ12-2]
MSNRLLLLSDRRAQIAARIFACVEVVHTGYIDPKTGLPSACHLWCGADSGTGRGGGYPRMKLNDRTVAVHIVSFTNAHGYVPANKQIDHMCRQRRCVNDEHLEMVSHRENQKRRDIARGLVPKRKRKKRVRA